MGNRRPNWYAAACGLAYMICFLLLPVYSIAFVVKFPGKDLLSVAPAVVVLLVCGLAMALSSILIDRKISMGVGVACAVITLLFGLLGSTVLPVGTITGLMNQGINSLLGTDWNVGGLVKVSMGFGLIICLILCILHVALEALIEGGPKTRKIEAQLWEDSNNGPIDF